MSLSSSGYFIIIKVSKDSLPWLRNSLVLISIRESWMKMNVSMDIKCTLKEFVKSTGLKSIELDRLP